MLVLNYQAISVLSARKVMSITQVLKDANLSNWILVKMKTGKPVTSKTVGKLANALGVDVTEIVVMKEG